jgi:enoyl-CoA hydratase/carnithine racemase
MTFQTLLYEKNEGVVTITLNRPDKGNAVNSVMSRELPVAWRRFEQDPQAVVAIVTGAGDRALCTGADLSDLPDTDGDGRDGTLQSIRWSSLQNQVWKPVICAVNGMAVGGGLHFVADADIVIASDTASFFDTHVRVGLVAGLEPVSLCRKMPVDAVMRMMLTGGRERLSAQRAKELGLVGEITSGGELLKSAQKMAAMIRPNSPTALARTKKAVWQGLECGLHEALEHAWQQILLQNNHADIDAGTAAFLEKRDPRWQDYSAD